VSKRERILAIGVACLAVALLGRYFYGRYDRALTLRQSQLAAAQDELATAKLALNQGEYAVRQMERWHERSLPANPEKALSLYKAWLMEKATAAGLAVEDIQRAQTARPGANVSAVGYRMQASGSLSSVVAMLYEFYRSPLLQQITLLRLTRPPGAANVQVTFQSEALILPGANATDKLPEGDSKRPKLASLAEYQKSLGDRDLVSVYTPPRPPVAKSEAPPAPPKFDDAEQAYFSGAVSNGGGMQAWINVRTTGETLHVAAGDPVKVGALEGQIVTVEPRSLVWQSGDKKFRVPLGESLRKGKELAADGTSIAPPKAENPES
jgi:hypothetical protein